jgi:uncharacterized protein YjbI with pentapeptide repeats
MKILSDESVSVGWVVTRIKPSEHTATFIVKGSFQLKPNGVAEPLEEALAIEGEVSHKDDQCSLRYESDLAPFKQRTDLLLVGSCHSPKGTPITACQVTFGVGPWHKNLLIVGNRVWKREISGIVPSEPKPFTSLELRYENAFGGDGYEKNPVGKGVSTPSLPNVVYPHALLRNPSDRLEPACFGPISRTWPGRTTKSGTYDEKWLKERWPWFPNDFDWAYYNAAPEDQQLHDYLQGDEELYFKNLHSQYPHYRSRLPGLRYRCFLEEKVGNEVSFREVPLNLDTLWVDMDTETLVLLWRGRGKVHSDKLKGVTYLLVVPEHIEDPPETIEYYRQLLSLKLADQEKDEDEDKDKEDDKAFEESMKGVNVEIEKAEKELMIYEEMAAAQQAENHALMLAAGISPDVLKALPSSQGTNLKEIEAMILKAQADMIKNNPELAGKLPEVPSLSDVETGKDEELKEWTRELCEAESLTTKNFFEADLQGLDLSGLDLSGCLFTGAVLSATHLSKANFTRANLTGADLSKADLTASNLEEAVLIEADLTGALLNRANLVRANLLMADLSEANLEEADLSHAIATRADFSSANLKLANLTGAELIKADFSNCDLEKATFFKANLTTASVEGAKGQDISMEEANITGLHASDCADFTRGRFKKVLAEGSIWEEAGLDQADFSMSVLVKANFTGASLKGAKFTRSDLRSAVFDEANLQHAVLVQSNILKGSFQRADLTKTDLRGSNVYEAEFWEAVINETNLSGANLKMTKLLQQR